MTDSRYAIDCVSTIYVLNMFDANRIARWVCIAVQTWLPKWRANNFQTVSHKPIKNGPLIRYLAALLEQRGHWGQNVQLRHVKGHSGVQGNEGADNLAALGTNMPVLMEPDWDRLEKLVRADISNHP
jgi:ribonuclease HI